MTSHGRQGVSSHRQMLVQQFVRANDKDTMKTPHCCTLWRKFTGERSERRPEIITLTSQWPRWSLKSPASRLFTQSFIQTQMKENIKAPRHWPLCGEFTGTGEFPAQRDSNAENVSIWWHHRVWRAFPSHDVIMYQLYVALSSLFFF